MDTAKLLKAVRSEENQTVAPIFKSGNVEISDTVANQSIPSMASLGKTITQTENQAKAQEHDGFWNILWNKIAVPTGIQTARQAGTTTAKLVTDPGETIGAIGTWVKDPPVDIPIDKTLFLSNTILRSIMEQLDVVYGAFREEEKYIDENGAEKSKPRTIFKKKISIGGENSLFDFPVKAADYMINLINPRSEAEKIEDKIISDRNKEKLKKVKADVGDYLQSYADGKPNNLLARGAYQADEYLRKKQEKIAPVNTSSETADWVLNAIPSLIASVASSYITYGSLGKLGGMALKTKALSSTKAVQDMSKAIITANMALIGTGSETMQIARDAQVESKDAQIRRIDKDYDAKEAKFVEDAVNASKAMNPDIQLKFNDIYALSAQARIEYQKQWESEQNQETRDNIETKALNAYNIAYGINMVNLAFEPVQASLFLHGGKNILTRNILRKPTRFGWKEAMLKGGLPEIPEELNNSIAQNAGVARSLGEEYTFNDAMKYIFSSKGANDAFWGFAGGHLQGGIGNMSTYKARKADYDAQIKVMAKQNYIGKSDQASITQFTELDNSFSGSVNAAYRIQELKDKGQHEAAKIETDRLLSFQAEQAFVTGTTQNLIDNYKKVADNDKFNDVARERARNAVSRIEVLEKIYENSRNYLNSNAVYHNEADQINLENTIAEWKADYLTKYGELPSTTELKEAFAEQVKTNLQKAIDEKKIDTDNLDVAALFNNIGSLSKENLLNPQIGRIDGVMQLNKLNSIHTLERIQEENLQKNIDLISKKTQKSAWAMNTVYERMAEHEMRLSKKDKDFDKYEEGGIYESYLYNVELNAVKRRLSIDDRNLIVDRYRNAQSLNGETKRLNDILAAMGSAEETPATKTPSTPVAPNSAMQEHAEAINNLSTLGVVAQHADTNTNITETSDGKFSITVVEKGENPIVKIFNTKSEAQSFLDKLKSLQEMQSDNEFDEFNSLSSDPKAIKADLSDEAKTELRERVLQMYTIMNNETGGTTFQDLMRYFEGQTDIEKAKFNFNAIAKGYKLAALPGFDTINYSSIYNTMYADTTAVFRDFTSFTETLAEDETKEELDQRVEEIIEDDTKHSEIANSTTVGIDENGSVYVIADRAKTQTENAIVSYYSIENSEKNEEKFDEEGNLLAVKSENILTSSTFDQDPFAPANLEILFPDKYSVGTELKAVIHPDFMNVRINTYDKNGKVVKGGSMTFGDWLIRENLAIDILNVQRKKEGKSLLPSIDEKSEIYQNKIPMAIQNSNGGIIGFVSDMERISDFHNTNDNIEKNRTNTHNIRQTVLNKKSASLVVTHKSEGFMNFRLGSKYDVDLKLLKDADPTSVIAIIGAGKKLEFGTGKEISDDQIRNLDDGSEYSLMAQLRKQTKGTGNVVELREVGLIHTFDSNGKIISSKKEYHALLTVQSSKLGTNEKALNTVYWAINAYLNKKFPNHPDASKFENIIESFNKQTEGRINLREGDNIKALGKLIQFFTSTQDRISNEKGHDAQVKDIIHQIQLGINGTHSVPFMFTQNGKVIIGNAFGYGETIKGENKMSKLSQTMIGDINDETSASVFMSDTHSDFMDRLKEHLPLMRLNVSSKGLSHSGKVPTINANGTMGEGFNTYDDYIKSTVRTTVDARKVTIDNNGIKESTYVTFTHPRIELQQTDIQQGIKSPVKEVLTGVQEGEKKLAEEAKKADPAMIEYEGKSYTEQEFQEKLAEELKFLNQTGINTTDNSNISNDPKALTESQIAEIKKSPQLIQGLTPIQQGQIIDYIFNNIAMIIRSSNNKIFDLQKVKDEIKNTFNNDFGKFRHETTVKLENLQKILKQMQNPSDVLLKTIVGYENQLKAIKVVEDNWSKFENDAIIMAKKYLSVKEVTNLEDNNDEVENEQQFVQTDGERDHNHSLTSLQINGKEGTSADIKALCQTITAKDVNGEVVKGIFGIPTFVGFDTIYNNVSSWLAESSADYESMINILKSYGETNLWVSSLIEKLNDGKNASGQVIERRESLRNEFVSAMTKHALDMEFVMMARDTNGNYSLKVYSTNSGAITASLVADWKNNIKTAPSSLIIADKETGRYIFNTIAIDNILREYEELKNETESPKIPQSYADAINTAIGVLIADKQKDDPKFDKEAFFNSLKEGSRSQGTKHFKLTGVEKQQLKEQLSGQRGTVSYKFKGEKKAEHFDIQYQSGDYFSISKHEAPKLETEKLINWLANFGIEISNQTALKILGTGKYEGFRYDSKTLIKFPDQFDGDEKGTGINLLGVLAGTLRVIQSRITNNKEIVYDEEGIEGSKLLNQTIIKALASMESRHTTHRVVQSFYDNHKSIYGFTASKYITDRIRLLKQDPANNKILSELLTTSFNQNSFWLDLLKNNPNFREDFKVIHLGLTAIKELGKTLYRDNELQKLSEIDHELVKLGFFQSLNQGDIAVDNAKYGSLGFRIGRMFSPTMSDKSIMTIIKTAVANITKSTMDNRDTLLEFGYSQMIEPELKRINNFNQKIKTTNIDAYDDGAKMFFMLPKLNTLRFKINNKETSLLALLQVKKSKDIVENTVIEYEGKNMTVKELLKNELDQYLINEQALKLKQWEKAKFTTVVNDKITAFSFLDKKYVDSRFEKGTIDEKVKIAAFDYVFNSMIANANSYMAIAGDPAMAYKQGKETKSNDYIQIAEDTLTNLGKRLANQIAPRTKLADSDNPSSRYIQLMMADVYKISDRVKYITKVLDGTAITDDELKKYTEAKAAYKVSGKTDQNQKDIMNSVTNKFPNTSSGPNNYFNMESTNAQEFTTWREHIYVLEKLGKMHQATIGITQEDIDQARDIFSGGKTFNDLSEGQKQLVQKLLQPMKPVYTGQIHDQHKDVMRTVYIKTSSFPLIPQLTAGMEIDKLAKAMEKLEKKKGMTVRASFMSGNKVGGLKNALVISDPEGTFNDLESMVSDDPNGKDELMSYGLELPRANFGIQQNVPLKSQTKEEDVISLGTQITKLLFGNIVMHLTGFDYNGVSTDGMQLQQLYTEKFQVMIGNLKNNLYKEIGVDVKTGKMSNPVKTKQTLSRILKTEAVLRGYPKQDIEALGIDPETGEFNLPIWLSPNSNRYEALLMAIISHRITKIKFPGYSYVTGSQIGFKMQKGTEGLNMSNIVFTDAWTGELKGNQVLMPSKFRIDGKLVDLIADGYATKVNGIWKINTDKISPDLMKNLTSFRIPSSKHSSIEQIEIAGFLPTNSADLIIVSADGTVAMGEDYDVDKRYIYHHWTTIENNKIIPLHRSEKYTKNTIDELITKAEKDVIRDKRVLAKSQELRDKINAKIDAILEKEEEIESDYVDENAEPFDAELEMKLAKEMSGLLDSLGADSVAKDIIKKRKLLSQLRSDKIKIYQNEILDIQSAVLKHDEVKKLTVKKLDIQEARDDADYIDKLNKKDNTYFTPLSDSYQRNKVSTGAAGRNGTAAYSLDVVSQSLFEQAFNRGHNIQLQRKIEVPNSNGEGTHSEMEAFTVTFGSFTSDGILGHTKTLDGARDVAEVHSERQNLMVDNATEGIAFKVHLNDYTMRVDKVLNMLGFDKGEEVNGVKNSISFLFISQPIIKQYVEMLEAENSNTAEFDMLKKEKIIQKLIEQNGFETLESIPDMDGLMTNEEMINQIKNNGENKSFQAAILKRFIEFEEYGNQITNLEATLNVDSKGIGKNLLESMEKLETIKKLNPNSTDKNQKLNKRIDGGSALIGNYFNTNSAIEVIEYTDKGYSIISKERVKDGGYNYVLIKPTTIAGTFAINGLTAANDIWTQFFPYKTDAVKTAFKQIMDIISDGEMRESKKIELKQLIFKDIKKFLYTDTTIDVFTENVQAERKRLFIDEVTKVNGKNVFKKESLARFLDRLTREGSEEIKTFLAENRLLQRFTYDVSLLGKPSFIKFDNGKAENFDEQYLYNAIIQLMDSDKNLGEFNGKPYTSTNLAQDLVAYSMLEGGIQEATQFIKYIPVAYLKAFGINRIVKDESGQDFTKRDSLGTRKNGISTFTMQFMQHHPALAKKITTDQMKDLSKFKVGSQAVATDLSTLSTFSYLSENGPKTFISIYNDKLPKGESKFQLYAYNKETKLYTRIPVLGVTGMAEYRVGGSNYKSLVNQPKSIYPTINEISDIQLEDGIPNEDKFNLLSKDSKRILSFIAAMDSPMGKLAVRLLPVVSSNTKFNVESLNDKNGQFDGNTNTITIDAGLLDGKTSDEEIARVILKEVVHSITDGELKKYVAVLPANPITKIKEFVVIDTAPKHIKRLVSIFAEVQKELNKGGELTVLMEKLQKEQSLTLGTEYNVTYAGTNIFEFIERLMTTPELQDRLNKIPFKDSDKSIGDKIMEWISDVLTEVQKTLGLDINTENITATAMADIFQIFETKKAVDDSTSETTVVKADNLLDILGTPSEHVDDDFSMFESLSKEEQTLYDEKAESYAKEQIESDIKNRVFEMKRKLKLGIPTHQIFPLYYKQKMYGSEELLIDEFKNESNKQHNDYTAEVKAELLNKRIDNLTKDMKAYSIFNNDISYDPKTVTFTQELIAGLIKNNSLIIKC